MRKNIYIIVCLICIILAIILGLFIENFQYLSVVQSDTDIFFSKKSGFYKNGFYLEIKAKGDIYYTIDGSVPTKNSIKYTKPIPIKDISYQPNTISMRTDTSLYFNSDYNKKEIAFAVPSYPIDKCNIIRAITILPDGRTSNIKSASYFIGYNEKKGYNNISVVSLITDSKNLFDYNDGIYVLGKEYSNWLHDKEYSIDKRDEIPANYLRSGSNTEKKAYIEFFNANKDFIMGNDIGIRIKGGGSRENIQKSFNLYSREEYSNVKNFSKDILNTHYSPKELTLFSDSDSFTKLNNFLIHTFLRNKNIATVKMKPCALFLNGEYWGIYYITEKYNKDFISNHYHIQDSNNIILVENCNLNYIEEKKANKYEYLRSFIENENFNKKRTYKKLKELIDINSFLEYYASQIYIANTDFSYFDHNVSTWRTFIPKNTQYDDGKWRLMLFDLDSSLIFLELTIDEMELLNNDLIFQKILSNNELRHKLAQEIIKLSIYEFKKEKVINFIEQYKKFMEQPMKKHISRYHGIDNKEATGFFYDELDKIENFFEERPKYLYTEYCKELNDEFGIEKEVYEICKKYR